MLLPEGLDLATDLRHHLADKPEVLRRCVELQAANRKLRSVIDAAGDAFIGMDAAGRIIDWNRQAEVTFGWSREEALGRSLSDTIVPSQYRDAHRSGVARFLATGAASILNRRIEITAADCHGREFPVELTVWAVEESSGSVSFHAFVHDISDRRAFQDALGDSEIKYRALADQLAAAQEVAGVGSWVWEIPTGAVSWSVELCRIFGVEASHPPSTYEGFLALVHPDDRDMFDAAVRHAVVTGDPFGVDHRVDRGEAGLRIIHARGDVTRDPDGSAVRVMVTAQDVTERAMAAEDLRRSESRLAEAQSTARLGSWEWDIAADRVTWSREVYALFGVDPRTVVASYQGYLDHVHPEDRERARATIDGAFKTGEEFAFDHRVERSAGAVAWIHSRGRLEMGADGVPARMYGTAIDITERVSLQQELAALALFDELTGLHNRRGFVTLADHHLKVAHRSGRSAPLLFVDVDGMKTINDTYGHKEGDRALVEVARFLRDTLRACDIVARIGGDEFCILMVDDGDDRTTEIGKVVAELRRGPPKGERTYPLLLSVGISHLGSETEVRIEDLMSRADSAMYEDKSSPRRLPRILVIEDDAAQRELLEVCLLHKYQVITSATGVAALEEAAAHLPDLILLDLFLPDMYGAEVLRRIRATPGGARVPVIVMTVANGREIELESLQDGVDDFVSKPLDLAVLEARIKNVLHRSSARPRQLRA